MDIFTCVGLVLTLERKLSFNSGCWFVPVLGLMLARERRLAFNLACAYLLLQVLQSNLETAGSRDTIL